MKHHHNHEHEQHAAMPHVAVRFEYTHPTATSVSVAGSFNDWKPEAKSLHPAGGGRWFKETILNPGSYEYRFIVDGQWMADPKARESVPNIYGGQNSVLTVRTPETIHLVEAETIQMKSPSKQKTKKL